MSSADPSDPQNQSNDNKNNNNDNDNDNDNNNNQPNQANQANQAQQNNINNNNPNDDDNDNDDKSVDDDTDDDDDYSDSDSSLDEQLSGGDPLKCRMYQNDYPNKDDLVIVQVKQIVDMGAYCNLLEYNNLEGMLLMTELQRRRIRSVKRVIKEGRQEIVQVLRVNREKHFIDLSKKRVIVEEIPKVEERWNKSKVAHSIMRQVSVLSQKKYSMKELYKTFGWKLAKDHGHLYDAFKYAMNNWNDFIIKYNTNIPNDIRSFLFKNIEKRLKPQIVTVRAKVEITCFTKEGVDAIKRSLKAGLKIGGKINTSSNNTPNTNNTQNKNKTNEIKIKLVAPPLFTVSVNTFEPDKGIKIVNKVIKAIHESINKSKGTLTVKQNPQIIAMES